MKMKSDKDLFENFSLQVESLPIVCKIFGSAKIFLICYLTSILGSSVHSAFAERVTCPPFSDVKRAKKFGGAKGCLFFRHFKTIAKEKWNQS